MAATPESPHGLEAGTLTLRRHRQSDRAPPTLDEGPMRLSSRSGDTVPMSPRAESSSNQPCDMTNPRPELNP